MPGKGSGANYLMADPVGIDYVGSAGFKDTGNGVFTAGNRPGETDYERAQGLLPVGKII